MCNLGLGKMPKLHCESSMHVLPWFPISCCCTVMQHSQKVICGSNVVQGITDVKGGAAMQDKSFESFKHVVGSMLIHDSKHAQGRCMVQGSVA